MDSNFWDLHRQLGECYERDIMKMMEVEKLDELSRESSLSSPGLALPRKSQSEISSLGKGGLLFGSGNQKVPVPPDAVEILQMSGSGLWQSGSVQPPSRPRFGGRGSQAVPEPVDEVGILQMSGSGLWQSAAFQEDLQVCRKQKGHLNGLLSSETDKMKESTDSAEADKIPERPKDSADLYFHPRAFWADGLELKGFQSVTMKARRSSLPSLQALAVDVGARGTPSAQSCMFSVLWMLQHPGSIFRVWWDSFGMTLLLYDLIVIPLRAFNLGESFFLTLMFWIAHLYWNAAILMSFISGYDQSGIMVLDLWKSSWRYVRSWFVFDLALVSFDWLIIASENDSSAGLARLSRTLRGFRFLRLLRLGRALRAGSLLRSLKDQLSSRMANLQYSIIKILFQLLLCNHIIACLWFVVGSDDTLEKTWVKEMQLQDKDAAFQYASSLHWTFTQLGVGNTEARAMNLNKEIFSIIISFIGLINLSTMVSSMTSLFANLQKLKDDEIQQFRMLRKHLAENNIDPDLSQRITRFLKHSFELKQQAMSKDGQIPILGMLSKSLQEELQLQRHSECLRESPFLCSLLQKEDHNVNHLVGEIVIYAMKHAVSAIDDVIFSAGQVATTCYYVADGNVSYEDASSNCFTLCNIWVAEVCLWTPWLHLGHLVAKDISRLITMEVTLFCECVEKNDHIRQISSVYAKDFVDRLNSETHWTDLPADCRNVDQSKTQEELTSKRTWWFQRRSFHRIAPTWYSRTSSLAA